MGFCCKKCGTYVLFFSAVVLVTLGLLIAIFWGPTYKRILKNELVLSNNSRSYNMWKETPIPMYLSMYLFNWTNSEEVLRSKWTVRPQLQECGPYTFSEHHIRVNLTWNQNGTVTYRQIRIWHFLPEQSNGTLVDRITNLNPIVAVVGNKAKDLDILARKIVDFALKKFEKSLIITKTVDELLFQGYKDNILDIITKLNISGLNVPFSKFGWFYSRNNSATYDGTFTMYTGKTDIELLGVMDLWNGLPFTNDYDSYCGLVNGTSGELWPPVNNYRQVSIFSSDICSSLALNYRDDRVMQGLSARKFVGTDFPFDNGTKYPEQTCFHGDTVVPSGTRDISRCKFNAPAFVSYPHFYLADPSYRAAVKGMHPNQTEHETSIILEPNTGIPVEVRAQLQINLYMQPISSMSMFENIKPTFIPMLWFRQTATDEYANIVKALLVLSNVGPYAGWGAFGIGLLMAYIGIYVVWRRERKDQEAEHLLAEEQ